MDFFSFFRQYIQNKFRTNMKNNIDAAKIEQLKLNRPKTYEIIRIDIKRGMWRIKNLFQTDKEQMCRIQ
jgi:hypothetical protein